MNTRILIKPLYLQTAHSNIFAIHYQPDIKQPLAHILLLPPLCDEMNKSRPMIAKQARQFCANGYSVIIFDLFGTGDSSGEFYEASIDHWLDDIKAIIGWLNKQSEAGLILWCMRFGASLLSPILNILQIRPHRMLLWQPQFNGVEIIQEVLNLRVLRSLFSKQRESIDELREKLNKDGQLEISGYMFSNTLISQIEDLSMDETMLSDHSQTDIIMLNSKLSNEKSSDTLSNPHIHYIGGKPFWNSQEIETNPVLLDVSSDLLRP